MKTIRYGTETVTCKAAQLYELLQFDTETSPTSTEFKDRIKTLAILMLQIPSPRH